MGTLGRRCTLCYHFSRHLIFLIFFRLYLQLPCYKYILTSGAIGLFDPVTNLTGFFPIPIKRESLLTFAFLSNHTVLLRPLPMFMNFAVEVFVHGQTLCY